MSRAIGDGEGQRALVPGHQIAEMALAKLYLATGDKKYLDQAKFFLDKRGYTSRKDAYSQAHKPVVEQDEAVGHAVRAAYMYAGMADVAALTGDTAYIAAVGRIWDNIVGKKLYITGGIGARHDGESFGDAYELPNLEAYCETCAAIGNVYVNHRLFLLHGDSKYYDVLERTLYNGLISGVSIDGGRFFYPNPLASEGQHQREPWFGCACCPSNICRFIPSLPGYLYAVKGRDVYANLYIGGTAKLNVGGRDVTLSQSGDYAGTGRQTITVDANKAGRFTLKLRIPGWARDIVAPGGLYAFVGNAGGYTVKVNGEEVAGALDKGYLAIDRKWKKGDRVELEFPMEPRFVAARPEVEADRGRLAVQRGPLVYCAEWPDNDFAFGAAVVNPEMPMTTRSSDVLGGVTMIDVPAQLVERRDGRLGLSDVKLAMIPYYAWAHRGKGKMAVWLAAEPSAVALQADPASARSFKIWDGNE